MRRENTTATPRVGHPVFARFYTRVSQVMERRGMAEHRQRSLAGPAGRVIEVGAGADPMVKPLACGPAARRTPPATRAGKRHGRCSA
ncbi:hypothetical protein [Streptosporangium sp. OZ121]|uniref:hypothetical protein n=1 Tax=Streptosporangium sp. OZ121 TaxID=3444183 RepID=UPI003F7B1300